ncbi:FtsX-like permease family protein, partial [Cryptosporangium sp. NPDC051539]|uniref:FtsX-like permease family protein n=1 Tax=Cryptosporangium sp. NPDC051539 TaxID=3363962 RepID=UPI0037A5A792
LTTLLTVLTLGATLLGTSTQLMTQTSQRAVEVAASRADPAELYAIAYTVKIGATNARSVAADTRRVLSDATRPFRATTVMRASSVMHRLPMASDDDRGLLAEAYLSGVEDLSAQVSLASGRWPSSGETVVFESVARRLGLEVGSRVHLGEQIGRETAPAVDLTVVGLVRPRPDDAWSRDPLSGTGFDPKPADAIYAQQVNAYGPFLVPLDDLLNSGSSLDRLEVDARPDLSAPTGRDLDRLSASLLGADRKLGGTLGDRVEFERVSSPIPQTIIDARHQQELIAGSVLAFALIGFVLTAIALALAGRLATGVRASEGELLAALGLSPGQFAVVAVMEALLLTVVAVAVAIPASAALHAGLTHLPPLVDAGLGARPSVTVVQVAAVVGGALALAVLHVVLAVRPAPRATRTRRELLARSGADVLLCALAAVAWWQLSAQPAAAGTRADAVRVLAPALILAASVALALRVLPRLLRRAERLAVSARGLVIPLATFQASRRPQAFAAGLLIGLGCAAATFGTAFGATWTASQHDQADLSVGTDLAVTLAEPPVAGQGAVVRAATGGEVSPVTVRNVAVGQWLGGSGDPPQLIALDTRRAAGVLRGRTDGSWVEAVRGLPPKAPVSGPALPRSATPTITGTASDGPLVVTPQLLLEDATGLRTTCNGPAVPLDGRPHPVPGCASVDGLRLVAVVLPVTGVPSRGPDATIDLTMTLPAGSASPASWKARAASPEAAQLTSPTVSADAGRLRFRAGVGFSDPHDLSRVMVATSFANPGPVPITVSSAFARDVKVRPGSKLNLSFGTTPLAAVVVRIVPSIPSVPGTAAALADVDTLSRALAFHGDLDSHVTAWWVGHPRSDATARVDALRLGEVTTRANEVSRLTGGPLRASLPAMLRVLVAAAVALLLGGVVLYVAYDVQLRALEVARLRGLGMSRRDIRAALLGEHAAVLLPLVVAGTLIGAAATWAVAPLLIRSDTGAAPVPAVVTRWPWAAEAGLLAILVIGAGLAVAAVVTVQTRRADAAHLRVAS